MSEFTPGKWIQSHRQIPNDPKGMYATQVYTEDGETIATLHWYPKPPEKVVFKGRNAIRRGTYRDGNAALISAAPDMLNALLEVRQFMTAHIPERVFDIVDNAVAKALGNLKDVSAK